MRKKSEQLVSGGRFGDVLRFLGGAGAGSGFSKAWNIKDLRLLTVLRDGDWFSKIREDALEKRYSDFLLDFSMKSVVSARY